MNFISKRYIDHDFVIQKKSLYLFIILIVSFVMLVGMSTVNFIAGEITPALAQIISAVVTLLSVLFLLKGKYNISVHVFLAICVVAMTGAALQTPGGGGFYSVMVFFAYMVLTAFLFSTRLVATLITVFFIGVQVAYYFKSYSEGTDLNYLNKAIGAAIPALIFIYVITLLIVNTLNSANAKMRNVLKELNELVHQLSASSENMKATSASLSESSNEQASSVEEISSSMEEMGSTIMQNASNAKNTDEIARKTSQQAEKGGRAVQGTVEAMKKITEKTKLIEDIAAKTNMLSLNASIEAARAQEHGKGFAVVASEVRKLAESSQVLAKEISMLSGESVKISEEAGKIIEEIVPDIKKTADLVQDIAMASGEQNSGVQQINDGLNQLTMTTQQNAASSEELASAASELNENIDRVRNLMNTIEQDQEIADSA
ncbi:MAG: hypothetical protein JW807_06810 [Spirochaetes bacterium]|nr:hypothetical protein [Spirochaetota bacterium]